MPAASLTGGTHRPSLLPQLPLNNLRPPLFYHSLVFPAVPAQDVLAFLDLSPDPVFFLVRLRVSPTINFGYRKDSATLTKSALPGLSAPALQSSILDFLDTGSEPTEVEEPWEDTRSPSRAQAL